MDDWADARDILKRRHKELEESENIYTQVEEMLAKRRKEIERKFMTATKDTVAGALLSISMQKEIKSGADMVDAAALACEEFIKEEGRLSRAAGTLGMSTLEAVRKVAGLASSSAEVKEAMTPKKLSFEKPVSICLPVLYTPTYKWNPNR
jgi:DNA-binding transcriptional MerR regulator